MTAATGAIYAIRRRLFSTVAGGAADDFAVSTAIIAQGFRIVFAEDAVAYEPPTKTADAEFGRKVRIITRGLRGVLDRRALFNPFRHGFYSLQLFSHKVLRRLMAIPLLVLLLISPWLWTAGPLYQFVVIVQTAAYGCVALGWLLKETRYGRSKVFTLPTFFVLVNTASMLAAWNVLRGRRIVTWKTGRSPEPAVEAPRGVLA